MKIFHAFTIVATLLTPCLAAVEVPLGAETFVPTPEHTVGWRGDGSGRYPGATPPQHWSRTKSGSGYETKGIVWAAPMPNKGISSPIVVGTRVFVTTEFADLVCLDKQNGRILWIRSNLEYDALSPEERKALPAGAEKLEPLGKQLAELNLEATTALNAELAAAPTTEYRVLPVIAKKRALEKQIRDLQQSLDKKIFAGDWPQGIYGFCTETPASDSKYVCAFFATGVSACYDLEGNRRWIAKGPRGGEEKGHFTSPTIIGNQMIVWGDPELRGYDLESGKVLWQAPAKGPNCSSVIHFRSGNDWVAGVQSNNFVRVRDGQPIWKSGGLSFSFTTPIIEGDMLYFWSPGYKKEFKGYQIPASTDSGVVTAKQVFKKVEWAENELAAKFEKGDLNASPLYVDGLIYQIYCGGGLTVQDAATGENLYRKILPLKPRTEYWAWGGASTSPTLAGKLIYLMDNQGRTVLIEPGREYKEVAVNVIEELGGGNSQVQNLATPFFEGSRMYYRSPSYVYCMGEK